MADQFFIKRGEKLNGPFSTEKVRSLIKARKLKSNDNISASSDGPWQPLGDVYKSILKGGSIETSAEAEEERSATPVADRIQRLAAVQKAAAETAVTITLQNRSEVMSVAFSPDGKRIVSGSGEDEKGGEINLWDVGTGQELATFKGYSDQVMSVAFSPDGKRIVSGGYDGTVKVLDSRSLRETGALEDHLGGVMSVAFSPDGKRIVSCGSTLTPNDGLTGLVRVEDAESGEKLAIFEGHSGNVFSAAFSPNGEKIVSGSNDGAIKIWDAKTGQEHLALRHSDWVSSVSFNPDGKRIVIGSRDGTVAVLDSQTQEKRTLKANLSLVRATFSPDGKWIVSGSFDNTVKLWDVDTGEQMLILNRHSGPVNNVAFSPDGKRIVSGSSDETIRIWDISGLTP